MTAPVTGKRPAGIPVPDGSNSGPLIPAGGGEQKPDAEAHSDTDGRRRVARDEYGWVKGVRWALGRDGGYCRHLEHAPTDYLGPNPAWARVSQTEREGRKLPREVRTCGTCAPPKVGADPEKRKRGHSTPAEWAH
jgi:hypothetical protein